MKTSIAIGISSLLGFAVTYALAPRPDSRGIPPTWLELPGTPVTVDGKPVSDWGEANEVLSAAASASYREAAADGTWEPARPGVPPERPEHEGREVRITYRRRGSGLFDGPQPVETVVVRTFLPITIDWSRAQAHQLARYEIARPEVGVE